jgi:hypothetical protein
MGLSTGQGNNLKAGANSLIGVNGPMNKRAPSTGRNGVDGLGQNELVNENFYKNNKRAQSLERAAAVHSSGNPGLNSLVRGQSTGVGAESFSGGINGQNPTNFAQEGGL